MLSPGVPARGRESMAMTLVYLVQHGEKQPIPGDPELTKLGRGHAARTGQWLRNAGLGAVYSSPARRAWQTAEIIADVVGLSVVADARLRERANWDATQPIADFLGDWAHSTHDRDFVPRCGDSSCTAAERLRSFIVELATAPAPVAAATHGGVTVDLLRTLLGDQALPADLVTDGMPSCAITTLDGLNVVDIASTRHLT